MGVKDLWTILEPAAEPCTMAELRGKRLAIDISGWIFQAKDAQGLANKEEMQPHLRILFWRLHCLVRNQIRAVMVFDGPTPAIKRGALKKRSGMKSDSGYSSPNSKFQRWNAECKNLLKAFRIPFIDSGGDAEATCAYLNQIGEVDGCITDDSDALLFGATTVYTHFTCDKSKADAIKCYRMTAIEETLKLTRQHLVALALLMGCDYGLSGVRGIGKEQAMRLINGWTGIDPLQRMRDWKSDTEINGLCSFDTKKPIHCRRCRHNGSLEDHRTSGCSLCGSASRRGSTVGCLKSVEDVVCRCDWHNTYAVYLSRQIEVKVRKAALEHKSFPDNDLISSYLQPVDIKPHEEFSWPRPAYAEVEACLRTIFRWDSDKVVDTLLPYFTAYDMLTIIDEMTGNSSLLSRPDKVVGSQKKYGRQLYKVSWKDIPDIPAPVNKSVLYVTTEFKDLFCAAFPSVAAKHEDWLSDKEDTPRGKKRKHVDVDVPPNQSSIPQFFQARKRLNFDSMAGGGGAAKIGGASVELLPALIVHAECQ